MQNTDLTQLFASSVALIHYCFDVRHKLSWQSSSSTVEAADARNVHKFNNNTSQPPESPVLNSVSPFRSLSFFLLASRFYIYIRYIARLAGSQSAHSSFQAGQIEKLFLAKATASVLPQKTISFVLTGIEDITGKFITNSNVSSTD